MKWTPLQTVTQRVIPGLSRHLPGVAGAFLVGTGLVIVSVWLGYHTSSFLGLLSTERSIFFLGLFAGMALCLVLTAVSAKGFPEYAAPVREAAKTWFFPLSVIIGIAMVALFAKIAISIPPVDGQPLMLSWWTRLHHDPGGIFAAFTGVATVYALALTVQSLREIRRTVSSFPELIDRLHKMAGHATDSSPLRILAYTPALGYIALRGPHWDKFHAAVTAKPQGKPITHIVCLKGDDLEIWHNLFVGRRTFKGKIEQTVATQATLAAKNLLDVLQKDTDGNSVSDSVHRLPWRFMPGFYLFFTGERALIVVPLFLPFPKGAPKSVQEELPSVQMIGLETQDRALMNDIEQVYEYYASLPEGDILESKKVVTLADLEDWVKNPNNADVAMRALRDDLLGKYPSADAKYKSGNEFELTLSTLMKTWQ